jgi:hypothetical protein
MNSTAYLRWIFHLFSERRAFAACTIVGLAALCVLGCTSRKQYAINEAILISERRQLEDEIYRAKFELRDALRENEQLRAQLEKNRAANSAKGKANSRRPVDEYVYPGGSMLEVDPARLAPSYQNRIDPDRYDSSPTSNTETLPDFAPVPRSNSGPRFSQAEPPQPLRQVGATEPASKKSFGVTQPINLQAAPPQEEEYQEPEGPAPGFADGESSWSPFGQ